jgi:hypothetical protein
MSQFIFYQCGTPGQEKRTVKRNPRHGDLVQGFVLFSHCQPAIPVGREPVNQSEDRHVVMSNQATDVQTGQQGKQHVNKNRSPITLQIYISI